MRTVNAIHLVRIKGSWWAETEDDGGKKAENERAVAEVESETMCVRGFGKETGTREDKHPDYGHP